MTPLSADGEAAKFGALLRAPDNTLWGSSVRGEEGLLVRVSAEGQVFESLPVSFPARPRTDIGLTGTLELPPDVRISVDANLHLTVWLRYPVLEGESEDEVWLFGDSLKAPKKVVHVPPVRPFEQVLGVARGPDDHLLVRGVHRPEAGDGYDFVEKISPSGEVLWRQTSLPDGADYSSWSFVEIAALPNGELMTATDSTSFVELDTNGNVVLKAALFEVRFETLELMMAAPDGRRIMAGTTVPNNGRAGGDLAVVRFSEDTDKNDSSYDNWRLLREEYGAIQRSGLTVAPDGDVIVTAWYSRNRDPVGDTWSDNERSLICRLSHTSQRSACFRLAARVESPVSFAAGEVIVVTPTGLQRIVLPEASEKP
jgi:hypothetical protein